MPYILILAWKKEIIQEVENIEKVFLFGIVFGY
jgi:hypothetical protein